MRIKKFNNWTDINEEAVLRTPSPINEEVGLRNLKKIAKGLDTIDQALVGTKRLDSNPSTKANTGDISNVIGGNRKCEIYFHKDLDGVTSALAMKQILWNQYQIECVDCHTIQYGGLEFAVQKPKPGNLAVLVDFAHSKPMFTIATDHHQEQVGSEDTSSTYYKHSRSNVETISGEIAKQEIFPQADIEFIQTIDSANFLKYEITPGDVQKSIFKLDSSMPIEKLKFMMGFVTNRLLLAYKNKTITLKSKDGKRDHINRNILECLVLDCSPNLYSMYNNLLHYINNAKTSDRLGRLATQEEISQNLADYIKTMKTYSNKEFDEDYKILKQYGGGSMIKPGSYDRYVVFENNPESEFNCITWPLGLIQVSCNPFKEKRLKDINLGEIAKEVLAKFEPKFKKYFISIKAIKEIYETSQDWKNQQKIKGEDFSGIGFRFSDLAAFYMDCIYQKGEAGIKNIIDKALEIEFRSNSDEYADIDVIINFNDQKFQFKVNESSLISKFVETAVAGGDISKFYGNSYKEGESFNSELSQKRIAGAKNNISNLLKSLDVIVSNRDKIMVFKPLKDNSIVEAMDKNYSDLSDKELRYLDGLKIPAWELIIRNSGGHPSITNISGLNFLAYNKAAMKVGYNTEKYTDIMEMIVNEFINSLKEKIDLAREGKVVTYDTKGVELLGQDINENFEYNLMRTERKSLVIAKFDNFDANENFDYQITDKEGNTKDVTRDEFVEAGALKAMEPNNIQIDHDNKRIIAKFEKFKNLNK